MSKPVLWTFPGKFGDAFLAWPVCYQWCKRAERKVWVGLSEHVAPLGKVFLNQPYVENVTVMPGITHFTTGGQPWDFGMTKEQEEQYEKVFHTGFRKFPPYNITRVVRDTLGFRERDMTYALLGERSLFVPAAENPHRYCVIHGTPRSHMNEIPGVWSLARELMPKLAERFPGGVFLVGAEKDKEYAFTHLRAAGGERPWEWHEDGGDWWEIARFVAGASFVLACGSSIAALAGALDTPCVRVHDNVANMNPRVWSNVGDRQLNLDLRDPDAAWTFIEEHVRGDAGEPGGSAGDREPEGLEAPGLGSRGLEVVAGGVGVAGLAEEGRAARAPQR